ncbi:retron St85 family effector protein [Pseudomonas sp. HK3]
MKFNDTRKEHLAHISLEKSRVDLSSPIIFLCGGLVDQTEVEATSIRSAFLSHISKVGCDTADQVTLAENFKDWIHDSVYKDLLDFENDIALISSLIVIILESPGALAELGLFVRNHSLNQKLIIFVNDEHYGSQSFISLGPLRYLEALKKNTVCAYPWDVNDLDESLKDSLPEMHDDLLNSMKKLDNSEAFDINNEGHISFVLYEIIRLFKALKITEIESYSNEIGITIKREKLKRLLFLLQKFELISMRKRGHDEYYYAVKDIDKIHFGGRLDKNKVKVSAMQYYAFNESESRRFSFIKWLANKDKEVAA